MSDMPEKIVAAAHYGLEDKGEYITQDLIVSRYHFEEMNVGEYIHVNKVEEISDAAFDRGTSVPFDKLKAKIKELETHLFDESETAKLTVKIEQLEAELKRKNKTITYWQNYTGR